MPKRALHEPFLAENKMPESATSLSRSKSARQSYPQPARLTGRTRLRNLAALHNVCCPFNFKGLGSWPRSARISRARSSASVRTGSGRAWPRRKAPGPEAPSSEGQEAPRRHRKTLTSDLRPGVTDCGPARNSIPPPSSSARERGANVMRMPCSPFNVRAMKPAKRDSEWPSASARPGMRSTAIACVA